MVRGAGESSLAKFGHELCGSLSWVRRKHFSKPGPTHAADEALENDAARAGCSRAGAGMRKPWARPRLGLIYAAAAAAGERRRSQPRSSAAPGLGPRESSFAAKARVLPQLRGARPGRVRAQGSHAASGRERFLDVLFFFLFCVHGDFFFTHVFMYWSVALNSMATKRSS